MALLWGHKPLTTEGTEGHRGCGGRPLGQLLAAVTEFVLVREEINRTSTPLFDSEVEDLRTRYNIVERRRGGFIHGGLAQHDHILGATHSVHNVHNRERQRGHDFVSDQGFWIGFEQ